MLATHFLIVESGIWLLKVWRGQTIENALPRVILREAPFSGHPERANKGESKDFDRGKKPRARCVSTKLFVRQNVTLRLERVSCKHTAESVTCTFEDSSGFFVETLTMTRNKY